MKGVRVFTIAVSLGLLVGSIAPGLARSMSLSGRRASALPRVTPFFGTAPQNCSIASASMIHHGQGTNPFIWVGSGALRGNSSWYIANSRLALSFGDRTKYGYPQKIFWQLINGSTGPVTLNGWNLRTWQRIWFGHPLPQANPKSSAPPPVIAWPSAIVRYHRAPTLTFVPSAGCYLLHATWRGGSWTVPFTAGG
jgi:hypothetical protein